MSSIFLACLTSWLNIRNIKYLITTVVKFLHENCRQFPSDVIYVRNLATKNIFDVVGHGRYRLFCHQWITYISPLEIIKCSIFKF